NPPWRIAAGGLVLVIRLTPRGGRDAIDGVAQLPDGASVLKVRVRGGGKRGRGQCGAREAHRQDPRRCRTRREPGCGRERAAQAAADQRCRGNACRHAGENLRDGVMPFIRPCSEWPRERPRLEGRRRQAMTAKIIDGKGIAADLRGKVADAVHRLARDRGIIPGLAVVLLGNSPASESYVASKMKMTVGSGMRSFDHRLPKETSEAELLTLIARLNADPTVHGILVQLPLPP